MKRIIDYIFFIGGLYCLTLTSSVFSQSWKLQATGLATRWQAVDAVDSNIAAAIAWNRNPTGGDCIFRTFDSGKSWHEISWIEGHPVLLDISITDSVNIWVATNNSICHTSDGGVSWDVQYCPDIPTVYVSYIEMFDSLNGIAEADAIMAGLPVQILKTNDGGRNWISQNQSYFRDGFLSNYWRAIDFLSTEIGYATFLYLNIPLDTVYVQKTIDGGKTWETTSLSVKQAYAIKFFNQEIGIATTVADFNNPVYRTLNCGETWQSFPLNYGGGWSNDIEFIPDDPAKVFAVFQKSLLFSNDTGKTWQEISTPLPDYSMFRDMKMVDAEHGWLVAEDGIIHTSTGGITSVIEKKQTIGRTYELYQNYPNPFNSTTQIFFNLSQADKITLKVYNVQGKQIAVILHNKYLPAGKHQFRFQVNDLASGIYFYRLQLKNGQNIARRMIFLK